MTHRGPDDEGELVDGPGYLGFRRLSIVDLEGGHQPMFNEDGTIAVVFNGEIYNHADLRPEMDPVPRQPRDGNDVPDRGRLPRIPAPVASCTPSAPPERNHAPPVCRKHDPS